MLNAAAIPRIITRNSEVDRRMSLVISLITDIRVFICHLRQNQFVASKGLVYLLRGKKKAHKSKQNLRTTYALITVKKQLILGVP